jgi:hexosaminidase
MPMAARLAMLLLPLAGVSIAQAQGSAARNLLPRPVTVEERSADAPFVLRDPVRIVVGSELATDGATLLADALRARTGFRVTVVKGAMPQGTARDIRFVRAAKPSGPESYQLDVTANGVTVAAASREGAIWGTQTLRQLLPVAFDSAPGARPAEWRVSAVHIADSARFGWRGVMIDAGRHFMPVAVIEKQLDVMSRYKLNRLHWHLTEDQGWRIEIKKYPLLTTVGAWRTEADGSRYGGFYTQTEIRHVVDYARKRGITVVPEIEMPGHSVAALASYPNLGCTGEALEVPTTWGVYADVYCPGKETTFTFLQNVLDEVLTLFPSREIHIGGDEVPKDRWRACESCQALMKREKLATEDELQRWFVDRMAKYLESKGRRLVGWNEIMHGGNLRASAVVQSWEDSSWTRRAVVEGHAAIASPSQWTYLNRSPGELTLEQVYRFDPVPPGLTPEQRARVLGSEVPLWSENITSGTNLELMAWPRALAFAEVMWSTATRDLPVLRRRITDDHAPRLRAQGVAVGPEGSDLMRIALSYDNQALSARLRLTPGVPGVTVRLSNDGRAPTAASPVVADSALLDGDGLRRLQPFYGDSPILGEKRVMIERHLALGAAVRSAPAPSASYPGTGTGSLSDGLVGSSDHGDGLWQGWWGPDIVLVMNLESVHGAKNVRVNFLQNIRSWIALPRAVEFQFSDDGVTWSDAVVRTHDVPVMRDGALIRPFSADFPAGARPRWLRITARNSGVLPAGHPGAGSPSWMFADEIVVR